MKVLLAGIGYSLFLHQLDVPRHLLATGLFVALLSSIFPDQLYSTRLSPDDNMLRYYEARETHGLDGYFFPRPNSSAEGAHSRRPHTMRREKSKRHAALSVLRKLTDTLTPSQRNHSQGIATSDPNCRMTV